MKYTLTSTSFPHPTGAPTSRHAFSTSISSIFSECWLMETVDGGITRPEMVAMKSSAIDREDRWDM